MQVALMVPCYIDLFYSSFDHGHDGITVESGTSIVDVKIRCDDGVELRNIVRARRSEIVLTVFTI